MTKKHYNNIISLAAKEKIEEIDAYFAKKMELEKNTAKHLSEKWEYREMKKNEEKQVGNELSDINVTLDAINENLVALNKILLSVTMEQKHNENDSKGRNHKFFKGQEQTSPYKIPIKGIPRD